MAFDLSSLSFREFKCDTGTCSEPHDLADESHDRIYLVVDGSDGKAYYVALNAGDELVIYSKGAVVEVKGMAKLRTADRHIVALSGDGLYRTDLHLAVARGTGFARSWLARS